MVQRQRDRRLTDAVARVVGRASLWTCVFLATGLAVMPAQAEEGGLFGGAEKALGTDARAPRPAAGMADYDAATTHAEAAWTAMPLAVRRALFVKHKGTGYGIFEERPNNAFAPDETMYVYLEPAGYIWKSVDGGAYTFGVSADLAIKDKDGAILFAKPQFAVLPLTSREKNREFMVNFDINVSGLKSGAYKAEITLHDLNGPKTTLVALPFKISGGT